MDITRKQVLMGIGAFSAMGALGAERFWLPRSDNLRKVVTEEEMYKEMWKAYFNNESGCDFDISALFPFNESGISYPIASIGAGQTFRNNRFKSINFGNVWTQASYAFGSDTLESVTLGALGNNQYVFAATPNLRNVYLKSQTSTSLRSNAPALFQDSSLSRMVFHTSDNKRVRWDADTSAWVTEDDV